MSEIATLLDQVPPQMKTLFWDLGILTVTFILARFARAWGTGILDAVKLDEHLELFRRSMFRKEKREGDAKGSEAFAFLFSGTIYGTGFGILGDLHGIAGLSSTLGWIVGKAWLLSLTCFFILLVGNWAGNAFTAFFRNPSIAATLESSFPRHDERDEAASDGFARLLGNLTFCFLFLLVFISFAEHFHLQNLMFAMTNLWNLGLRLISVGIALLLGFLGITYVERLKSEEAGEQAAERGSFPLQARIGIVLVTTIFALDLLVSTASTMIWVVVLVLLGVFLAPLRGYLIDIWAGFSLEFHSVRKAILNGRETEIEKVGLISCRMKGSDGAVFLTPNREVLAAFLAEHPQTPSFPGAPPGAFRADPIPAPDPFPRESPPKETSASVELPSPDPFRDPP